MSKGVVHRVTTLGLAATSGILLSQSGLLPTTQSIAFASGCAAGILLTPDLDLAEGCDSQNMARRSFGWPLAALWRLFWLPYSMIIPHRSFLSHGPIIGTVLRLIYLSIPIGLIAFTLSRFISLPVELLRSNNFHIAILGLMLADTVHYIMDKMFQG